MAVRFDDGGAAQMRESDGWRDEDPREDRRKIGPARAIAFSPRVSGDFPAASEQAHACNYMTSSKNHICQHRR